MPLQKLKPLPKLKPLAGKERASQKGKQGQPEPTPVPAPGDEMAAALAGFKLPEQKEAVFNYIGGGRTVRQPSLSLLRLGAHHIYL